MPALLATGLAWLPPSAAPAPGPGDPLAALGLAAGLALVVERAVEVLKNVAQLLPRPPAARAAPGPVAAALPFEELIARHRAAAARAREEARAEAGAEARRRSAARLVALERDIARAADPARRASLAEQAARLRAELAAEEAGLEWPESVGALAVLARPAAPVDDVAVARALALRLLAAAAGILAARLAGLRLFGALLPGAALPAPVDFLLTGLLVGGGSGPVHVLVRFVTERRPVPAAVGIPVPRAAAPVAAPAAAAAAPAVRIAVAAAAGAEGDPDWLDIPYDGGVDPEALESVHRRPAEPDLVVLHHTAMHAAAPFEDVVRVIRARRDPAGRPWLTGYHCVVLPDGSIHPFCRWDRYGNHAAGHNRRSLGIAFHGSFEPDPHVPGSNPDGRLGPRRPTPAQLEAGARVVALWSLLYDIPPAFGTRIVPHRALSSKPCPGALFPLEELEALVLRFYEAWRRSSAARARIEAFRHRPYVYATRARAATLAGRAP